MGAMGSGPWVKAALRDLGITLDARELIPLKDARRRVRDAAVFANGKSRQIPGQISQPTDGDFLWGALLSLESAEEFVREATRLSWEGSPRGFDNISAFERYGEAILPWLARFIGKDGKLPPSPSCVLPCLVAIGNKDALDVLRLIKPGVDKANVAKAIRAVKARVGISASESADAKSPSNLDESRVLAILDEAASSGDDTPLQWPLLGASVGHFEPHAMRVVAARSKKGNDFGVLFEVVQGDRLQAPGESVRWPATIQQYRYGSNVVAGGNYLEDARPIGMVLENKRDHVGNRAGDHVGDRVVGPRGTRPFLLTDAITKKLSPTRACSKQIDDWKSVLAIRARLERDPDAFWIGRDAQPLTLAKNFLRILDPILVVATGAFEHVSGPGFGEGKKDKRLPSATETYRSLAAAIVSRDPKKFVAGKSNVDWRSQIKRAGTSG